MRAFILPEDLCSSTPCRPLVSTLTCLNGTCLAFYNTAPSPSGPSGTHCELKPDTNSTTSYPEWDWFNVVCSFLLLAGSLLMISTSAASTLGEVNKISTSVSRTDNWGMGFTGFTYYAPVGLEAAIFGKKCPILQSWRSEDRCKRVSHFVAILSWWWEILHQNCIEIW